jgi:hypothetical protein
MGGSWEAGRRSAGLIVVEWSEEGVLYGLVTSWCRGSGWKRIGGIRPNWVVFPEESESLGDFSCKMEGK